MGGRMAAHIRFFKKLLHTWPDGAFFFDKTAILLNSGLLGLTQLGSDQIRNFPTEPNLIRTWRQGLVNWTETNRTEPGARAFEIGNLKIFFSDARGAFDTFIDFLKLIKLFVSRIAHTWCVWDY